jgi:hypothetical protein
MSIRNLCPQGGSRLAVHSGFSRAFWVVRGEKTTKANRNSSILRAFVAHF